MDADTGARGALELGVDQGEPPLDDLLGGRRAVGEGELGDGHTWTIESKLAII